MSQRAVAKVPATEGIIIIDQAGQSVVFYRVREDRSCWTVVGEGDLPLGVFLMKGEAINRAWDAARRCRPSVVTVELADGTVEGEFRFGAARRFHG